MRSLVVAPNWIGDAVMAQPLLAQIMHGNPGGQIDVVAPPATASVFRAMAEVSAVIEFKSQHGKLQLLERFKLGRTLARQCYDRAYVLPNSLKSALIPFFAGIKERIGHRGE